MSFYCFSEWHLDWFVGIFPEYGEIALGFFTVRKWHGWRRFKIYTPTFNAEVHFIERSHDSP